MIGVIHSSCSFRTTDTSSGFLILPAMLTGRIRCFFVTANRHRRNLICLFIIIQADKCKCNCWTALVPRRSAFRNEKEAEERATLLCAAVLVTRNTSMSNDNFFFKKREVIFTLRRDAVFCWMFREHCYLFGQNSERSLCTLLFLMAALQANHAVAAVQQFVNSD